MNPSNYYTSRTHKDDAKKHFWKLNNKKKRGEKWFPFNEFLNKNRQKTEEAIFGPGAGIGIGCGIGIGLGFVGGIGYGGWPWNHVKLAFGLGMGCGVGLGLGYGQGLGLGMSLDSLMSVSEASPEPNKWVVIQI